MREEKRKLTGKHTILNTNNVTFIYHVILRPYVFLFLLCFIFQCYKIYYSYEIQISIQTYHPQISAHTILFKSISWKKKKRKHWVNSMKVTRVQNTPNCRLTSFPKAQIDVPGREKTACIEVHRRKRVWQKPDCKWVMWERHFVTWFIIHSSF